VFPWIGKMPISQIKAPDLLSCLRRVEARSKLGTAHRALQVCGRVFRYAVATGRAERDPSGDLRGALPPKQEKHHASFTDPTSLGDAETKERFAAVARYQGLSDSALLKRLVELMLQSASAAEAGTPGGTDRASRESRFTVRICPDD
jgi:hypothetical protein